MTEKKKVMTKGQGIVNELSYIPKATRKKIEEQEKKNQSIGQESKGRRARRGVKELKLKKLK